MNILNWICHVDQYTDWSWYEGKPKTSADEFTMQIFGGALYVSKDLNRHLPFYEKLQGGWHSVGLTFEPLRAFNIYTGPACHIETKISSRFPFLKIARPF